MTRAERHLRRLCAKYGCDFEPGKKHIRVLRDGRQIAVVPRSHTESGRGLKNIEATLRRGAKEDNNG